MCHLCGDPLHVPDGWEHMPEGEKQSVLENFVSSLILTQLNLSDDTDQGSFTDIDSIKENTLYESIQFARILHEGKYFKDFNPDTDRDITLNATQGLDSTRNVRNAQSNSQQKFKRLKKKFFGDLRQAMDWFNRKAITKTKFEDHVRKMLRQAYHKSFRLGFESTGNRYVSQGTTLTGKDRQFVDGAWKHELKFLNNWLRDIGVERTNRRFSHEQRLEMYANALDNMYNAGRLAGTANSNLIHWVRNAKSQTCESCWYLVRNSPYLKSNLPTMPRAGLTRCLTFCNCRLITKKASKQEIENYTKNMKSKDYHYRRLLSIKKGRRSSASEQSQRRRTQNNS